MGKFCISAPVDDVMLGQATRPHVDALGGRLPSADALRRLAADH
ncbi:hypothetical protein [Massilia glaciei]|nr:hypothetical protein [Massilia glaciei]